MLDKERGLQFPYSREVGKGLGFSCRSLPEIFSLCSSATFYHLQSPASGFSSSFETSVNKTPPTPSKQHIPPRALHALCREELPLPGEGEMPEHLGTSHPPHRQLRVTLIAPRVSATGGEGREPALTADCSASLRWVSRIARFASCSSFPTAILCTQEEGMFISNPQTSSAGPIPPALRRKSLLMTEISKQLLTH